MYCFASPLCSPISGRIKYIASVLHFKLLILMALDFKLLYGVGIENGFLLFLLVGWFAFVILLGLSWDFPFGYGFVNPQQIFWGSVSSSRWPLGLLLQFILWEPSLSDLASWTEIVQWQQNHWGWNKLQFSKVKTSFT